MLDDLAVLIETEDVDPSPVSITGPFLMAMQHDEVALGDDTLEVDALPGELPRHSLEVLDERVLAVGYFRVVLNVLFARVLLDGLGRTTLIEHQIVELSHHLLVSLCPITHAELHTGFAAQRTGRSAAAALGPGRLALLRGSWCHRP